MAIDLGSPRAREVVSDLVRVADVVVENFVPGVMARLGCDYAALAAVKPDLVYCSISGFGQSGPLSGMQAFAHIINAISGMMALERAPDPHPRVTYLQAADVLAGTHAFGAILAALLRRGRTGQGAYLDVSMLECLVAAEDVTYGSILNGGPVSTGPRIGMIVHRVGDGYVATQTVGAPQLWPRLLELLDRRELAADPRFATPVARRENWAGAARHHHRLARPLREGRRRGGHPHRGPHPRRARPLAGGGRGPSAPGGPGRLSHGAAPGARRGPRHGHAVPGGRAPVGAGRARAVSRGRAHAAGSARRARLRPGADRGARAGRSRPERLALTRCPDDRSLTGTANEI